MVLRSIVCSTAILTALLALYFFYIQLTSADWLLYDKLVQDSADLRAHRAFETSPVRQMRKEICKDVWAMQEGERVHGRVKSQQSDLTLFQKKRGKIEAVEVLNAMEGWIHSGGNVQHMTAEKVCFDKNSNELLCFFPQGYFEKHQTLFKADTGRMYFQKALLQPQTFLLEGNVQIVSRSQEKESFATADSALFNAAQKKIIFESCPDCRVLFHQNNLDMSAPTIHIQEGTAQGFGDVRFFFYREEAQSLETIFHGIMQEVH